MNVFCYYDDPLNDGYPTELISRWWASFEANGFVAKVLCDADARKHPDYEWLYKKVHSLPTINDRHFTDVNFTRWCAYQLAAPGLFTDYDIINYSLKPKDIPACPVVELGGWAVYSTAAEIQSFINSLKHAEDTLIETNGQPHAGDVYSWYQWFNWRRPSTGQCVYYGDPGFLTAKMVHYRNISVPPRFWFNERHRLMDAVAEIRKRMRI